MVPTQEISHQEDSQTNEKANNDGQIEEEQNQEEYEELPKEITSLIFGSIKIANWNLQIFGDTKSSNSQLMQIYSSIIEDYDIIFIQEIRDIDGSAFVDLCFLLPNYDCRISSRAGRSSSKEQYGIIYKKGIEIKEFKDFNPDSQDRWERPPVEVTFDIEGYDLIVYNIHIKPDDAKQEIDYLDDIVKINENIIILGDLNADCSYYNNPSEPDFDNWNWLIGDNEDTTSSSTNCAYDRIILNQNSYGEYLNDGIYKSGITSDVSDHYLIWVELNLDDVVISSTKPSDITSLPQEPEPDEEEDSGDIVCSSDYYNCGDFSTHSQAQALFEECGGANNDIHQLDKDKDGVACESLP